MSAGSSTNQSPITARRWSSHRPAHPAYLAVIQNSLGLVLTRQGRDDAAANEYVAAARLNPVFAEAQSNLGNVLAGEGPVRRGGGALSSRRFG